MLFVQTTGVSVSGDFRRRKRLEFEQYFFSKKKVFNFAWICLVLCSPALHGRRPNELKEAAQQRRTRETDTDSIRVLLGLPTPNQPDSPRRVAFMDTWQTPSSMRFGAV